jgi:hypothetical protein
MHPLKQAELEDKAKEHLAEAVEWLLKADLVIKELKE